jgi:hypothetical protein
MYLRNALRAATALSLLTAGGAFAETITIATVNNGDMIRMQKLTDDFTKKTGHEVNWVTLEENALRQRVTQDIAAKGGQFDIMTIGMYETPIWGKNGWLVPPADAVALLDDVLSPQPTNVGRGNDVLGQIFGSKDVSRTVARGASAQSGLDPAVLRKMLPMLAMLVGGFLSQRGAAAAPRSGAMPSAPHAAPQGGLGDLASMLDLNGDGNPLDDILNMAGQLMR